jgi:hypothetical protein
MKHAARQRLLVGSQVKQRTFKFSSQAPVTTVQPSGLSALHNTLSSCAGNS